MKREWLVIETYPTSTAEWRVNRRVGGLAPQQIMPRLLVQYLGEWQYLSGNPGSKCVVGGAQDWCGVVISTEMPSYYVLKE